jgi:hypothetical protein
LKKIQFLKFTEYPYCSALEALASEVLDSRDYDTKADIYSLGTILQNLFDIDMNWY